MRRNLPVVIVTLLAVATLCTAQKVSTSQSKKMGGTSLEQRIIDKERKTWEAYKSRNIAAIRALTAPDYVANAVTGPSNLEQDIANIEKLTIESYTIDDPKVTMATRDAAILRYKCDLKGSFDGKSFSPVYATSVWVNRGGKWQVVSYTETPVN